MGCKAAETTHNINITFGPGTTNKCTVQWWFKQFCKGDESLEDKKHSGQPLEVDNNKLRAIIEADPLTTIRKTAKELNIDHSMIIQHLKQTEKVKMFKWVPHELIGNPKNCHFLSVLFLLYTTTTNCYKKWILHNNQQQHTQ